MNINWEQVYCNQMPHIYNFFRYRVGNAEIAEDLTAVTFEKAWEHRERYRHDLGSFTTWLFTIARNVAIDHFRKQHPIVSLDDVDQLAEELSVGEIIQHQNDLARLNTLLARLSDRERELVALKYGAELTNRMIAQLVGLSESNVGTILHRIVQKLRQEWETV